MPASRRDFLSTLGLGLAAGPFLPLLQRTAGAADRSNDRVLVVVQLAGGNDGLNTVVPYEDDAYGRARPTLRLAAKDVHKLGQDLGFHPSLKSFHRLFQEGTLAVVQGVGYPKPNPGHGESMRIWQAGQLDGPGAQTGWIGRTVDAVRRPDQATAPALFLGEIRPPFALNAARSVIPVMQSLDQGRLAKTVPPAETDRSDDSLLALARRSTALASERSRRIEAAVRNDRAEYPAYQFAAGLRTIAQLIRADVGIRIFVTELGGEEPGGFDTHAGQAANHGALLEQLSRSVTAFVDDLATDKTLDRVLLMTFSEFGRTVEENGRRGTDHGSAAPVFLAGGRVRGGLIGPHPNLTDLENGGQKHHTDFRRLYAAALGPWLGIDPQPVLGPVEPLDVVRAG